MNAAPRLIAILCAVPQELGPLTKRFGATRSKDPQYAYHRACVKQTEIRLAAVGMGSRSAGRMAEALFNAWSPDLVIVAGVAGALSPGLQVGDLIVADPVLGEAGMVLPVPFRLPVGEEKGGRQRARYGPLLSLDRVLVTAAEKRSAYAHATYHPHPPPLAVEMETAGVARAAQAKGIPWAAVRAVSDTASEDLPVDFNKLRGPSGDLPTSRVAMAALTNPGLVPGLMRLGRNTQAASAALADYLYQWVLGVGS